MVSQGLFGDRPFLSRLSGPGIGAEQRSDRRGADAGTSAVFGRGLAMDCRLLSLGGDDAALDERADQLIAVATEQGFPLYRALGTIYRGWVKVKNGDVAEGISLLRSGSSAYSATGAEARISYHIALLAEACEIAGQVEEALIAAGRCLADRRTDRGALVRGGAVPAQRPVDAAAGAFRGRRGALSQSPGDRRGAGGQALGIARRRQPRPALPRPGPPRRSPDLLAPVYGWFTEGFDTQDLKGAKALLDELS